MVPGCRGTKKGTVEFCAPCYKAYRNCGFKKLTAERRKQQFIIWQASRLFNVELATGSDTESDETSDDAPVTKKRKVLFFPHMHPHIMYPHTQAQAQPVPVRSVVSASYRQDRAKLRVEKQSAKPVSQGLSFPWVSSHMHAHICYLH